MPIGIPNGWSSTSPATSLAPRLEEISEEQKAFTNTLKPDAPRRSKTGAPSKPAQPPAEDKGYRPYMWQFCIGQEAFLKGELDLIQELVSKYELDGVWLDGGGSPAVLLRRMPAAVAQEGPRSTRCGRAVCSQGRASSVISRANSSGDQESAPWLSGVPPEPGDLLRPRQARAVRRLFLPGGALHGCSPLWLPLFPDGDSLRTRLRDTVPWLYGLFQGLLGRLRRLEVAGANAHGSRRLCIARRAMRHRRPGASRRPARTGDLPRHRTGLPAHRTDRAVPGTGGAGDRGGAAGKRVCSRATR